MNYYPHHIGDFNNATRHLTRVERSIYRDMLDMYYDTELPLPLDTAYLCRKLMARTEEESTAVEQVLNEFFNRTTQGWHHDRCEQEIAEYRAMISAKSAAGKASAAKRAENRQNRLAELNSRSTAVQQPLDSVGSSVQLTSNQEPVTNKKALSGKPSDPDLTAKAKEAINYLNEKTGSEYRHVPSNLKLVQARINEGYSLEDVKAVIDAKTAQWGADPKMVEYLRPKTLFGAENFNQYAGQRPKASADWWTARGFGSAFEAENAGVTKHSVGATV